MRKLNEEEVKKMKKPNLQGKAKSNDVGVEQKEEQIEVQQIVADCSGTLCTNSVIDCITVLVKLPFSSDSSPQLSLAFDTSCLKCIVEPCSLPASTTNPCGGQISGSVIVNRVRVVGCINYVVSVAIFGDGRDPTGNIARSHFCAQDTVCVDQTLCIVNETNQTPCPNFANTTGQIIQQSNSVNDCGDRIFNVRVRFNLPSCVTI
ncbi:hypothetical protein [Sporosarcina highlanderae]|uniref:Uncharacterized protein n=1 Tax=Sporosarcina highlanderae TaxID=3035916 RepID=A0ABT8JN40_9BACL|nr:hypothetical protein [Sporosarcina highlanderae]MDN4605986.1 hypothetical protein [Sporosarcina highlanderae]